MKNIIKIIDGMPVEIPVLDEQGEKQRKILAQLAFKEYKSSGSLTSQKLQEANSEFLAAVKGNYDDADNNNDANNSAINLSEN